MSTKVSDQIEYTEFQRDLLSPVEKRLKIVLGNGDQFRIEIQDDRVRVVSLGSIATANCLIVCPEASNVVQLISGRIAQA